MSPVGLIMAIVVLLAFALFVGYLAGQVAASETTWTRLAWLFSSVEAIAFGAAGGVFGSTIRRHRAERAEESARQNSVAAARGQALAALLKSDDTFSGEGDSDLEELGPRATRHAAGSIAARHAFGP
jgi:hypothetical protein